MLIFLTKKHNKCSLLFNHVELKKKKNTGAAPMAEWLSW